MHDFLRLFFFSSRRRHTRCALVTGVQTCALPILSMAIERERLPADFSLAGWTVTGAILPEQLEMTRPPSQPRWNERNIEERRSYARVVVSSWTARHGPLEPLRIALPAGSGSNLLFRIPSSAFARIGVP